MTAPADSALTEKRAQLGKRLFFDSRLSSDGKVACGSCHKQEYGFSDSRAVSLGVGGQPGTRNAPDLANLAWSSHFFWDGRAASLEDQAGQPIENPIEMNLTLAEAVSRLNAEPSYLQAFDEAYGGPPDEASLRKAIASFVRTLVSGDSPYDRYLAGNAAALDEAQLRGEALFFSEKAGCFNCHPDGALTNDGFFNDGSYVDGGDIGRQKVTGLPGDLGKFKVPGLRNVAVSAPYMHDGSLATLADVIDQYDRGGRGDPSTDPQIRPLALSDQEKSDLLAFLQALTDSQFLSDSRLR